MLIQAPLRQSKTTTPIHIVEQYIAEKGTTQPTPAPPRQCRKAEVMAIEKATGKNKTPAIVKYFNEYGEIMLDDIIYVKRGSIKTICERMVGEGRLERITHLAFGSKISKTIGYRKIKNPAQLDAGRA